jgi:hypothetical protein
MTFRPNPEAPQAIERGLAQVVPRPSLSLGPPGTCPGSPVGNAAGSPSKRGLSDGLGTTKSGDAYGRDRLELGNRDADGGRFENAF